VAVVEAGSGSAQVRLTPFPRAPGAQSGMCAPAFTSRAWPVNPFDRSDAGKRIARATSSDVAIMRLLLR